MDNIGHVEIADWLSSRVAGFLDRHIDSIDIDRPLAEYGLDSVYALTLCGEIEDTFEIEVEPTLAWDHPTIAAMARFLETQTTRTSAS
ncbi:acyl carrier protein [Rhodococcus pyridinivorans]|uniref:acyl carrier protein n=1 Tax=Rhodococcus TaxID=1827 RepID=UPI0007E996BA|nr:MULTISPECIES: acyl carrier protein [Rhodococcus]APE07948.1 polyketide synthase [Rhodococcus sp. 2G]MCD2116024.1 acyl carrier protein [Rhodococcus pyridinivorans]MCW3469043.1 acyl carrier protein [Rhodococcus pyridinivorans]MCZ4624888.1 acyl carrier protein [Rhodococcus pyridinivorans]MCZ4646098.1 acyl carrier protein [Rhodococcus pyridinivorans]